MSTMDVEEAEVNNMDKTDIKLSLPLYYRHFYPHQSMYNWLSYGEDEYLSRREFSFTVDDIYSRYNAFNSMEAMKTEITKRNPDKFDIGAIYNTSPVNHTKVSNFVPEEKELVFDIDATDYADVFVKTEKTTFITTLTWPLMSVAIRVLDDILKTDFGFEHIMWVFSGRRGIHGWVCDKEARLLNNAARNSIAEYLQVIGHSGGKKVNLKPTLHPTLKRVYDNILKPMFLDYFVKEQELLLDPKHIENVLKLVPDDIRQLALTNWGQNDSSVDRWNSLENTLVEHMKGSRNKKLWTNPIHDIVFTYTYPRLDINVSKQMNHLLKSPFVIHPGTGRVCVPIDINEVVDFKPENVPTVGDLRKEIDSRGASGSDFTSKLMKPYVDILDSFVKKVVREEKRLKSTDAKVKNDLTF